MNAISDRYLSKWVQQENLTWYPELRDCTLDKDGLKVRSSRLNQSYCLLRLLFNSTDMTIKNFSSFVIETERLILRPQQPDDYDSWLAGFSGRLPAQHQYDDGWVNLDHCDRSWFADLCERHQREALTDQVFILGIFLRQTGQHLGNIDFSTLRRGSYQWAILGYEIHNHYWNQGLGQEAVRSSLIAGFKTFHYHRIEAAINLDNQASIALAEKIGMQKECIRRGFIYENEQWVDHVIYVALPSDLGLIDQPPQIQT